MEKETLRDSLFNAGGTLILFIGDITQQMTANTPLKTLWRLWIDCAWRVIDNSGRVIFGSYDDNEKVCSGLREIQNSLITRVDYNDKTNDIAISLDNDIKIQVFCNSSEEDQWHIRKSDGYRLGVKDLALKEWYEMPD